MASPTSDVTIRIEGDGDLVDVMSICITGKCAIVGANASVLSMLYALEPKSWRIGSKTWCYSSGNEYIK